MLIKKKKNPHWVQLVSDARPSVLKASHQTALHKRNELISHWITTVVRCLHNPRLVVLTLIPNK